MSSKWSSSLKYLQKSRMCNFPVSHMCCVPRPSHSSRYDPPNNSVLGTGWAVQIIKLLVLQSSRLPCYRVPLRPISPSAPCSQTPSTYVPPSLQKIKFTTIQNKRQNHNSV
jgi:hypothetical protein